MSSRLLERSLRLATACACAALVSGCGIQLSQPDGGRLRLNCTNSPTTVPVKVLDREGNALPGAEVMAKNATDGRYVSGLTNGNGVYAVPEDVAPGTVNVSASFNDLWSPNGVFTFVCGECDCTVSPRELTLQLQ